MKEIQLKQAKATFSQVVDEVVAGEPAVITRHGKKEAVVISYSDYERLSRVPSLGWLLTNSPLEEGDLPLRSRKPARALRDSCVLISVFGQTRMSSACLRLQSVGRLPTKNLSHGSLIGRAIFGCR